MQSPAVAPSRKRLTPALAAALGLAAYVGLAACVAADGGERTEQAQAHELAEPGADGLAEHHRGHHRRGPVQIAIEATLESVDLSPDQEVAIQALAEDLDAERLSKEELRAEVRASAVDVVRTGTADSEQFERTVDQASRAFEQRVAAGAEALVELHAILDADQRAAVADALRERLAERAERHRRGHHHGRLQRIAEHLMLSTVQIDQLRKLAKQLRGERKQLRPSEDELLGLIEAFEGDAVGFEDALDALRADKTAMLRERVARAGTYADVALSVLSAGQRELLADVIEQGPRAALLGEPR